MSNNYVDDTGLHTQSISELVTQLSDGMKTIYGVDINLDQNSPDGQMINIFAQAVTDLLDAVTMVYNSFNPTVATGVVLDQRCALNGVVRQGASYTRTNITITTDRILTLPGLDTFPNAPFIVSDATGNQFALEVTQTLAVGANVLEFISLVAGQVETTVNTLTNIVTVTLGVLSANNPTSAISTGVNEETDANLRIRRQQSVSLPSIGYLEGLIGALRNIANVTDVAVYENDTGTTDVNGIPGHSIWCVVDGGSNSDIADVIYVKRNAGCGMKGSVTVTVTQINGIAFAVKFDRPVYEDLYIQMVLESIDPAHVIDTTAIKTLLYNGIVYGIYDPADFTAMTTLVKEFDPLAVVLSGGVNDVTSGYTAFKYPSTIQGRWLLDVTRMDITAV